MTPSERIVERFALPGLKVVLEIEIATFYISPYNHVVLEYHLNPLGKSIIIYSKNIFCEKEENEYLHLGELIHL